MLCLSDSVLIVFNDHHGIALVLQGFERVEQQTIVSGMKADSWLIEDVANAAQIRAQLRCEPDTLSLATT